MINRKEDITNYLGRALFVVLFLLLLMASSDHSVKSSSEPIKVQSVTELSANLVNTDAVQLPVFKKNQVSLVDKMNFRLFNATFKRLADNRAITQRFNNLQQTGLRIKPPTTCRFYYHLFPKDTGEVPILG